MARKRSMYGKFKADWPHQAFKTPLAMHRKCDEYFDMCDEQGKPYSLPGLALYLGLRTRNLQNYDVEDEEYMPYRRVLDYAIGRIESFIAEQMYTTKGSTRGMEFLAQNTLGYSTKSEVNGKQQLELTEKERIKQISDEELMDRLGTNNVKIVDFMRAKKMVGNGNERK